MTSRQKLLAALGHQAGPVPTDIGATGVTGVHVSCVAALREHFGLERRPVKVVEPYQMLGEVDDELVAALPSDAIGICGRTTMFGYANENWREWRTPWGQEVLVPEGFRVREEASGDVYIFPQGDDSVDPSGHMPAGGFFFDSVTRQEPIDEDSLDPGDNCEEFVPLSDEDLAHWRRELERVGGSDRGVVASFGGTGFGDIALVPAPFLKRPRGIRDVAEWYMTLVERPDYVHAIFDYQCGVAIRNLETFVEMAGDTIDVLFVCGTDFGTQSSQFCSLETFNDLYAPYYRRVNEWVHRNTSWKTMKHSCGAVRPLIPAFIEVGFDILNPVQCSAVGMAPEGLKRDFGRDIVFWGGGVDTQRTLPFGTPDDVRKEVTGRLEVFADGGGFVFNTIHNIQARTPVENIVAMLDAIHAFNGSRD